MANKITVTSAGTTANVNATPDSARYYSDKSKEWAISDRIVDNIDYSSKYYANESKKQADISAAKATEVVESGNTAVSNIESARDNAIIDITNQENLSVDNVNTVGITQVANVNSAGTTQINLAKEQVTLATNQANIATEQATIATNKTSEVVASGNEALSNIDTAKTGAITDITDLKNTSVSNITTAKNNAITSITTQETTSKNNVIATGNEQVERVNLTGVDNRTPIFTKSEIGTNEGVYQNVYDLKHSTFDKSKFTVVGSPTITDDGVASGFSNSNYINTIQLSELANKSWDIEGAFEYVPSTDGSILGLTPLWAVRGSLYYVDRGTVRFAAYIGVTNDTASEGTKIEFSNVLTTAGEYYYKLSFNLPTGKYTLSIYDSNKVLINSGEYTPPTINKQLWDINNAPATYITISKTLSGISDFIGTTNLKHFSITVDGKEVFSGNKTGLDVIKPDNYTVVGSPVITDDGVASGFSDTDYITCINSSLWANASSWHLSLVQYFDFSAAEATFIHLGDYSYGKLKYVDDWNSIALNCFDINNEQIFITIESIRSKFIAGNLKFDVYYSDQTGYYFTISQGDKIYTSSESTNTNKLRYSTNNLVKFSDIPIDLNSVLFIVDGNLVYQPCLKIPYTESKTGSKIVPAYARDRVIDLYEQEGQAGYYTIDEENQNFTLPMGEVYGMIGQRSLISSTVTETNRVDIYSDKTCLICGNVATAGTINLPIELVNNNYFITLPTSAKTATSFTTTATGDYILIGKVI